MLALAAALAASSLSQTSLAPAAIAHDRIDTDPRDATALGRAPGAIDRGDARLAPILVPLPDQEPATTALIETDLDALPRPAREGNRDAIRFGPRQVPRRVVEPILRAAERTGVDPVYMMALADKESRFDTDVRAATSSAEGLFQFITGTWLEMIRDYGARHGLAEEAAAVRGRGASLTVAGPGMRERVLGLRRDPYVAALMAAEMAKRDRGRIEARIGRALTSAELYLAHLLGKADAGRFLTLGSERPNEVAEREFRTAARTNRGLFTERTATGRRSLTVAELSERIDGMIDRRLARYQGVAALADVPRATDAPAAPVQVADAEVPGPALSATQ